VERSCLAALRLGHEPVDVNTPAAEPGLAEHLPALLRRAGVEEVEIHVLDRRPSFRGAEVSDRARGVTAVAREEHLRRGFGFWEYVVSRSISLPAPERRPLLQAALRHNSDDVIATTMTSSQLAEALASERFSALPARTLVSLCSRVPAARGQIGDWHLPMLDLGAHVDATGRSAVLDALNALRLSGDVWESGKSFHFIGDQVLSDAETWRVLGRAQLLSPIVDSRWVSHQMIDGACSLRISTDVERNQHPHRYVATLG
jgi:hypothetical protein